MTTANAARAKRDRAELKPAYLAELIGMPVAEVPHELLAMKREQMELSRLARTMKRVIREQAA